MAAPELNERVSAQNTGLGAFNSTEGVGVSLDTRGAGAPSPAQGVDALIDIRGVGVA